MELEIIKYEAGSATLSGTYVINTAEDLRTLESQQAAPVVWVVSSEQLAGLKKLGRIIDYKGKKHKAMQLTRILRKGEHIPVVDGDFSSAGKLERSVQSYLKNDGDTLPKLAIIVTGRDIIESLRHRLPKSSLCVRLDQVISPAVQLSDEFQQNALDQFQLLVMGRPMPQELIKSYLGESLEVQMVRHLILLAGEIDNPVLVTGDTGTGKEIVARKVHYYSNRRTLPFRPVNCSAIPHNLLESELFGHLKGSFTDAFTDKTGLWLEADGGTLFLDEIGDLAPDHQAKILRTLESGRIRPVGSNQEIPVNARIIAATNRNLLQMVQEGKFREDLYYRLRGFLIHTPALRSHREDIPLIASTKWEEIAGPDGPLLGDDLLAMLRRYDWPGNVRELKMVLTFIYGLFRAWRILHIPQLQMACALLGITIQTYDGPERRAYYGNSRHSPLCHLQRVFEVIKAVEHILCSVKDEKRTGPDVTEHLAGQLRYICTDLEQLCRKPALFTPETFEAVNLLHSRLVYFVAGLKTDAAVSLSYWRENGEVAVKSALVAVQEEIEELKNCLQEVETQDRRVSKDH
jgi:hypothetical protein